MNLIFLVWGLFLIWVTAMSFFSVCWLLSPWLLVWLVLWWPEPAPDIEQGLLFALWLWEPCLVRGLLPSCWSRNPQVHFWAAVWDRWDWSTSTGRGATVCSLQAVSTGRCTPRCHQPRVCSVGSQSVLLAVPQPHLKQGNEGSQSRCPLGTVFPKSPAQIHWHRFAEVRPQDSYSHAPWPAIGARQLA